MQLPIKITFYFIKEQYYFNILSSLRVPKIADKLQERCLRRYYGQFWKNRHIKWGPHKSPVMPCPLDFRYANLTSLAMCTNSWTSMDAQDRCRTNSRETTPVLQGEFVGDEYSFIRSP